MIDMKELPNVGSNAADGALPVLSGQHGVILLRGDSVLALESVVPTSLPVALVVSSSGSSSLVPMKFSVSGLMELGSRETLPSTSALRNDVYLTHATSAPRSPRVLVNIAQSMLSVQESHALPARTVGTLGLDRDQPAAGAGSTPVSDINIRKGMSVRALGSRMASNEPHRFTPNPSTGPVVLGGKRRCASAPAVTETVSNMAVAAALASR